MSKRGPGGINVVIAAKRYQQQEATRRKRNRARAVVRALMRLAGR